MMRLRSSAREYGSIQVVGRIWMPNVTAAMEYDLSDYDVGNIEHPFTRETVEYWLALHSGDFQEVLDFSAYISGSNEQVEIPWENEENELTYLDCMYPSDDSCDCGEC
jgi:hypothetical protein